MSAPTLARVEQRLQAAVAGPGLLGAAAAHLVAAKNAKRARPRLVLAFARLAAPHVGERDELVRAAAAVELIHTASLLHDDVVDAADTRRAIPSANARFGNGAAVLAGDVVLARALGLLAFDARAVDAAIDAVGRMSAAAVREIEVRGATVDVAEALTIAEGKTGALFGLCGTLAALAVGAGAHARALDAAGRAFGVAFQVADDIDDVEVDQRDGYPTVPLLLGAARAQEVVDDHVRRAKEALAPFATSPGYDEVLAYAAALGRLRTQGGQAA